LSSYALTGQYKPAGSKAAGRFMSSLRDFMMLIRRLRFALPPDALFAPAFRPTTIVTFPAMLVLSGTAKSSFEFLLVFGIGTALPIFGFAGILAFHNQYLSKTFQILSRFEQVLRHIASALFLLIGILPTLRSLLR
jgi:hypothetical protein